MRSLPKDLRLAVGLILVLVLSGCGTPIPIPAEKQNYVGAWTSPSMCLTITEGGAISYERVRICSTTTIRAPIKAFAGDDIIVGILFIDTTFNVQQPPYHDGATWRMRVDGVDLVKTDSPTGCEPVECVGLQQLAVACLRKVLGDQ